MSEVVCDKCGGATKPKQITSKKNGKTYTLYECQNGCMNGKYPYSCFAPKVAKVSSGQDTALLEEIKAICLAINDKLPAKVAQKKKLPEVDVDSDGFPFPTEEDAPF